MLHKLLFEKSDNQKAFLNDIVWIALSVLVITLYYLSWNPEPEAVGGLRREGMFKLLTLQFIVVMAMQLWYLQHRMRRYWAGGLYRDTPARITLAQKAYRKQYFEKIFWLPILVCLVIFLLNQVIDHQVTAQYFAQHIGITTWKEPWRLLLSQIYHYNLMHFSLNIGIFLMLGRVLAVWYTRREMLNFLLIAFTVPAFLNLVLGHPLGIIRTDYWTIGMSAVVYAGLGVYLTVLARYHKVFGTAESVWMLIMAPIFIIALVVIQDDHINHEAHVLGALVGLVWGWWICPPNVVHVKKILRAGRRMCQLQETMAT